jgi:hypothetical protein
MNEPAFPFVQQATADNGAVICFGMDLRDYFAAKAMQGLLAGTKTSNGSMIVKDSYAIADAMMKARQP